MLSSEKKMLMLILIPLIIMLLFTRNVHAQTLTLTLTLNKQKYTLGETVHINGSLYYGTTNLTDALVAIQVNTPSNQPFLVRTRPTGTNITKNWILEITSISTVNELGNQANEFRRGTSVGFDIKIRNNQPSSYNAILIISALYPNGVPFYYYNETHMIPCGVKVMWEGTIPPNGNVNITATSLIPVPLDAPLGTAVAYANLLVAQPMDGGYAYCPEQSVTFQITTGTGGSSYGVSNQSTSQTLGTLSIEGNYNVTFKLPYIYAKLGNYTVHATAFYEGLPPYLVHVTAIFTLILRGDITGPEGVPDGKCDITDVATAALAFGSYPGHPQWNPIVDMNGDDKIDIVDVATVASDFGKIAFP